MRLHEYYFEQFEASEGSESKLRSEIEKQFGSLDAMIETFNAKTAVIQGSGWGWLGFDPTKKSLVIASCSNQDPLSTQGLIPLLGVDVWEHAYYLDYQNKRPDYLKNIWKVVEEEKCSVKYLLTMMLNI